MTLTDRTPLLLTHSQVIPATWTDFNGHMNETHYLELGAAGTDAFLGMIGAVSDYVAAGYSYFTAESHVRYLNEVHEGASLDVVTQVMGGAGKKLHLFHRLMAADDTCVATVETLLIHVSLETRRSSDPQEPVRTNLAEIAKRHADLPAPEGLGRAIRGMGQ